MNLVLPKLSKNQIDLLMLVLNTKCSGYIDRSEFMHVADLLNVPISQVNDRITWLEKTFPSVYLSFPSQRIKEVVQTIYFKSVYDLVVIIEVFLIGFDVPGIDIPFCVLFYLEIGLKVYTYGPFKYFKRPRNWFDVIITVLCSMFLVLDTVIQSDHYNENIFKETTQAFNIIRIFRILRLLFRIKRFKTIINTLMNVSLSILVYCVIVFIFVYIFNVIGMELFKGRIQSENNEPENKSENLFCGTKELENSEFASASYCDLNFNDFISSTFVLATMLFENNWHRILCFTSQIEYLTNHSIHSCYHEYIKH
ncbi:hypothetical protein DPMN_086645 [Dreissena polymorpha]|uniref:Ion transport domain-containing protein n=1 Tax=Dreissena polymorpha TaxID=45954 RepID=A0A9D4KQV4_DREPO|nr:hypothetical protein DPMN_086645 [Dreissena polymorpha]